MGFFACTSKFILFVFNLFIVLLSLAVLGIGIYGQINSKVYGGELSIPSIFLIVLGALVTLIAFFGCWGAIQENRCFLHLYASILLVLLFILIAIGAYAVIKRKDAEAEVKKVIEDAYEQARTQNSAKDVTSTMERLFHCCGIYGPLYYSIPGRQMPPSCCKGTANAGSCNLANAYQEGCEDNVVKGFRKDLNLLGIFAIVVGCVELGGVILAFILSNSIRRADLRSHI